MKFERYMINETKTGTTTLLHEVGVSLFAFDPRAKVSTKDELVKELSNHEIYPVDSSLSKVSFDPYISTLPDVFTGKDLSTLVDARGIGEKIRKIFGKPSSVWWTGPTNDASEFGSSDIVVRDKTGKYIPISLKKGKGQLKNMGLNVFSDIIFDGVFDEKNILDMMFSSKYIKDWDTLTEIWLNILSSEGLDKAGDYADNKIYNSWLNYQSANVPESDIADIQSDFTKRDIPSSKLREIGAKYYGSVYGDSPGKGNRDWIDSRNKVLDIILGDLVDVNANKIRQNLKNLFKVQMSSSKHPIWLVASGGKDIMYIPSNDDLELFANSLLKFDFDSKLTSSGYTFTIYVKKVNTPLMDIHIDVRWKKGQMNGKPATASTKKMYIKDKEWNDMFNKGNIWEGKLVADIINEWLVLEG